WLDRPRAAGGARRAGDAGEVQMHEQRLAVRAGQRHVGDVRRPHRLRRVDDRVGHGGEHAALELVAQRRPPAGEVRLLARRQRAASPATGCTTPTSLFTHITLTTATPRSSAAASASSSTAPQASTGSTISSPPSRATACAAANTALCSIADTATRNGPPRSRA